METIQMRLYQKTVFLIIPIIVLAGCMEVSQPLDAAFGPTGSAEKKTDSASMKRFQDTNPDGPTAVESAIELSKKYAALSDETTALKLEKQTLASENSHLKQQAGVMEQELNQAQKELAEANDLLVEMQLELNNWKTDILGFRDEIRKADKAQLETLLKILKVLGGEVKTDTSSEHQSQDPTK
jgi:chromosome segregation ATPase